EKPSDYAQAWHINPSLERLDSALVLTLREDDLAGGLGRMRPQDAGYDSLRAELSRYRGIVAAGGWPTVPEGRQLHVGDSDSPSRLAALRARLVAEGYIVDTTRHRGLYDKQLATAVDDFQVQHAIGEDGTLGAETLTALNLPADYRTAQIAANLERYR